MPLSHSVHLGKNNLYFLLRSIPIKKRHSCYTLPSWLQPKVQTSTGVNEDPRLVSIASKMLTNNRFILAPSW